MTLFFAFVLAMVVTMVLIPPLMLSAQRLHMLDVPDVQRKVHARPIPRIGGVAMVTGCVIPILLWAALPDPVLSLLLGIGVILGFGVCDDRFGLDFRVKFFGQLIAVSLVVFYGGVRIDYVPFHGYEPIPEGVSVPLTMFALLGVTNAINLADGLDGLAGGTTLISFAMIALLAYLADDMNLLLISLTMIGCIIGFLRFNTYPAQIFMGDGGSQFLGFSLGVLVVLLTQQTNSALSPAMPLLLLGLPLIDTFLVMGQRMYEGRSPFSPDQNHIHHRLLGLGFDHYEAVMLIYALQTLLVACAYAFRYASDLLNMSLFAAIFLATIAGFRLAALRGWRLRHGGEIAQRSPLARTVRALRERGLLTRLPLRVLAIGMPLFFAWAILRTPTLPVDGVYLATGLLAAALTALTMRRATPQFNLVERALLYAGVTLILYYYLTQRAGGSWPVLLENAWFVAMTAACVMVFRFIRPRSFTVTPLDFLVLIMAVLVPNLLAPKLPLRGDGAQLGEIVIKVFVCLYAGELVLTQGGNRAALIRAGIALLLGLVVFKALWAG